MSHRTFDQSSLLIITDGTWGEIPISSLVDQFDNFRHRSIPSDAAVLFPLRALSTRSVRLAFRFRRDDRRNHYIVSRIVQRLDFPPCTIREQRRRSVGNDQIFAFSNQFTEQVFIV